MQVEEQHVEAQGGVQLLGEEDQVDRLLVVHLGVLHDHHVHHVLIKFTL